MSEQNKAIVRQWFREVWEQGNADSIPKLFAGRAYGLPDLGSSIGPEEFRAFHATFLGAFSEIQVRLDEVIAEGDSVAARFTCTTRHTGPALGFAATYQPATFLGAIVCHIRDGRIEDGWNYLDMSAAIGKLRAFAESGEVEDVAGSADADGRS